MEKGVEREMNVGSEGRKGFSKHGVGFMVMVVREVKKEEEAGDGFVFIIFYFKKYFLA